MSMSKQKFAYSRAIKLPAAVGDWTTIQYRDENENPIHVSTIKNIGFNSLPKEKVREAHYIHYRLAENLIQKISSDLDIHVELHTVTASQMSYQDFISQYNSQVVQCDFQIDKLGKINLVLDWGLADCLINRLTGGNGEETHSLSISEIEMSILQGEIEQLIPTLTQQWRSLFSKSQMNLDFICGRFVPDKKLPLREAVCVFSFYVYFGKSDLYKIVWAYPSEVLRKLLYALSLLPDPIKPNIQFKPKTIKTLKTPVKAVLGRASLTMRELKSLQVGDIVPLDSHLDSPIEVLIGDRTKLSGQLGVFQNHVAVQLIFMDPETTNQPQRYKSESSSYDSQQSIPFANVQLTNTQDPIAQPEEDSSDMMGGGFLSFGGNSGGDNWGSSSSFSSETPPPPPPAARQPQPPAPETSSFEEDEDEEENDLDNYDHLFESEEDSQPVAKQETASFDNGQFDEQDHDDLFSDNDDFGSFDNEEEEEAPKQDKTQKKPQKTTSEDDFSWDSLDDHF